MAIDERRRRIRQLDRILAEVLKERLEVVKGLAREKKENEMPVEDKEQEEKVLDRAEEFAGDPDVRSIFEEVIEVSKSKMEGCMHRD